MYVIVNDQGEYQGDVGFGPGYFAWVGHAAFFNDIQSAEEWATLHHGKVRSVTITVEASEKAQKELDAILTSIPHLASYHNEQTVNQIDVGLTFITDDSEVSTTDIKMTQDGKVIWNE